MREEETMWEKMRRSKNEKKLEEQEESKYEEIPKSPTAKNSEGGIFLPVKSEEEFINKISENLILKQKEYIHDLFKACMETYLGRQNQAMEVILSELESSKTLLRKLDSEVLKIQYKRKASEAKVIDKTTSSIMQQLLESQGATSTQKSEFKDLRKEWEKVEYSKMPINLEKVKSELNRQAGLFKDLNTATDDHSVELGQAETMIKTEISKALIHVEELIKYQGVVSNLDGVNNTKFEILSDEVKEGSKFLNKIAGRLGELRTKVENTKSEFNEKLSSVFYKNSSLIEAVQIDLKKLENDWMRVSAKDIIEFKRDVEIIKSRLAEYQAISALIQEQTESRKEAAQQYRNLMKFVLFRFVQFYAKKN